MVHNTRHESLCNTAATKAEIESASAKPPIPLVNLDAIPSALKANPNWCLWHYARSKDGRWTKVPLYPVRGQVRWHLHHASSTNQRTWNAFGMVAAFYRAAVSKTLSTNPAANSWIGLGYFLDAKDGITAVDLDDARNRDTGVLTPAAQAIVARLDTYTETSPSGTGLKSYAGATKPGHRCKIKTYPGVEVFDNVRFVAITGLHQGGSPAQVEARQPQVDALYAEMFAEAEGAASASACDRHGVAADRRAPLQLDLTDQDVIDIASRAKNGHRFQALWNGDRSNYPSSSEADLELASKLAFWCGPDFARIESLMRQSGLRRAKWDSHKTYLRRTIEIAIAGKTEFFDPDRPRERPVHPDAADVPLNAPIIIEGWKTICGMGAVGGDGASSGDGIASAASAYGPMPVQSLPLAEVMATIFTAQALTYYQTEQGSDGAETERQLQAELAAAANQVEQRRRERATLCPHCDTAPQRRRDGQGGRVLFVGCDRWDCPVCRLNNIERWQLNFRIRIQNEPAAEGAPPGAMYEFWCPDSCWDSVRRAINAADGKYFRAASNGMVYCTVAPRTPHVAPARIQAVDKSDVIRLLCLAVEQTPLNHHRRHPITHSTGWGFPRVEDGAGLYVNVGKGPSGGQMLPAVRAILAHHGMAADERGPKSIFARIRHAVYFRFPDWWGERRKARVFGDLLAGEVMEDAEEVGPLVFVGDDGEPLRDADGSYVFRL